MPHYRIKYQPIVVLRTCSLKNGSAQPFEQSYCFPQESILSLLPTSKYIMLSLKSTPPTSTKIWCMPSPEDEIAQPIEQHDKNNL